MSAMATMAKTGSMRSVEGRSERHDGIREIETNDMTSFKALVTDGWLLLSITRS